MMKQATPRTSQQPKTNPHACVARYSEVVRGLNQRPSRKRRARVLPARRGRATITAAAAIPAPATTASATRAAAPAPGKATATAASGVSAALVDQPEHDKREADCPQTGRT